MSISMSPNDKYVTQTKIYDCPLLGPLTDRRIAKYQREGRYGDEYKEKAKQLQAKKSAKRNNHKREVKDLLTLLGL